MAKFKTIHNCDAALGGVEYRATSDGETVNIQTSEWGVNNRWKTVCSISKARFDEYVNDLGMDSPYGGRSPSRMWRIVREQVHGEYE